MNLFAEINRTNHAYCAALGLSADELYGTPVNESEIETHRLIAAGVPAETAFPFNLPQVIKPFADEQEADDE